jgi:hypothetical protein
METANLIPGGSRQNREVAAATGRVNAQAAVERRMHKCIPIVCPENDRDNQGAIWLLVLYLETTTYLLFGEQCQGQIENDTT